MSCVPCSPGELFELLVRGKVNLLLHVRKYAWGVPGMRGQDGICDGQCSIRGTSDLTVTFC